MPIDSIASENIETNGGDSRQLQDQSLENKSISEDDINLDDEENTK